MSCAEGFGTTWLKKAFTATWKSISTTNPPVTARKRPHTYSRGVSGVE